jgi:RNA polymerase sigma factor (sigma-70 family)
MEQTLDEYALALRASNGDSLAVAALVERTRLRLFSIAYSELRHYDDAQDAVAAALLSVCLHIGDLREPSRVIPWMQSIVRREAYRIQRGQGTALLSAEWADLKSADANTLILRLDIERALRHLPERQAQAIRLFYLEGRPIREIAQNMGVDTDAVSEGQVKVWLHRGRQRLTKHLEGYAPMTLDTAPLNPAFSGLPVALLHSDLAPDLLTTILNNLRKGGAAPVVLTPDALPLAADDLTALHDLLKNYEAIIVDEHLGAHSGLEYVLFCRSQSETRGIHITLLHTHPEDALLTTACFLTGVDQLACKSDPKALLSLFPPAAPQAKSQELLASWTRWVMNRIRVLPEVQEELQKKHRRGWMRFTERARKIVYHAQVETQRRGGSLVGTEHLLLGLVKETDCAGARILAEKCEISLERVVNEINSLTANPKGRTGEDMLLDGDAKRAIEMAHEEADALEHDFLGSEHLLLGLLREAEGNAGRLLASLGLKIEVVRTAVSTWHKQGE